MCLGIPAKIVKINGDIADASIDGAIIPIGLQLIENAKVGDYVIVHTGYALEKMDEKEALVTIEDIKKLRNPEEYSL